MANDKTPNYHWDIPNPYGIQIVEMFKVASTFGAIDNQLKAFVDAFQSHKHSFEQLTDIPTTLSGYGITDAMTTDQVKSEIEASQTAQQSLIDQSIQSLTNSSADALALRVRVDAAQAFTLAQKSQARQNIDALGIVDKGASNGVASLDAAGKVPTIQLPDALLGAVRYIGVWDASTNTPAIPAASASNKGWYYMVSVTGTTNINGNGEWVVGDWIVSNGARWDRVKNVDAVISVADLRGAITAAALRIALSINNVANKSEAQMAASGAIADALGGKQSSLGFTPVQQGGGAGQGTDKLRLGWLGSTLGLQVNNTDFGSSWPINIQGAAANLGGGWTAAYIQNQLDWRITDTRFNGYIEHAFTVPETGNFPNQVPGAKGYVLTGIWMWGPGRNLGVGFRQPQVNLPNAGGWRPLGTW